MPYEYVFFLRKSTFLPPIIHEIKNSKAKEIIICNEENNQDKKLCDYILKSGIYCEAKINKSNYKTKLEESFSKNDKFIIQTNDPNLEYIACLIGLKNNCSVKFITSHCGSYLRYLAIGIKPQIRVTKLRIQSLRQTIKELIFSKSHDLTCYDDEYFQHIIKEKGLSVTNNEKFDFSLGIYFSRKILEIMSFYLLNILQVLRTENTTEKNVSKRASFINILKKKRSSISLL